MVQGHFLVCLAKMKKYLKQGTLVLQRKRTVTICVVAVLFGQIQARSAESILAGSKGEENHPGIEA